VKHSELTGAELHIPKTHKVSHENEGLDAISVTGLSGVLADKQDANKLQGKSLDAQQEADDGKVIQYDHGEGKFILATVTGGGDVTTWTTGTRPITGPKFGYNTDTDQFEMLRADGSLGVEL